LKVKQKYRMILSGAAAGTANGLLGAGGGMLLVPMLSTTDLDEDAIFPSSVAIILPICLVSIAFSGKIGEIPLETAWGYLLGGALGAIPAGLIGRKIPSKWLHRILGCLILWGGVRYLC